MAALSDEDKKILLGADFKETEARQDVERGITDESRLAKTREDRAANLVAGAIGVGSVAFIIGLANYFSHGTPYSPVLVTGCIVVVLASAATVAWFTRSRKSGER